MPESGWTVDTLKEYVETRFSERDMRYQQRFESSEKALTAALDATKEAIAKAENAAEKRFESVNEFRAQMGDQQRTLMPRSEAEFRINALCSQVDGLDKANIARLGQSRGLKDSWALIVGGVSLVIAVVVFLINNFSK